MPNWVEGNLKIRGTVENVYNFLSTVFKRGTVRVVDDALIVCSDNRGSYLELFDRTVITNKFPYDFDLEFDYSDPSDIIVYFNVQSAWRFNAEQALKATSKYNLQLKFFGFDKGQQFTQDVLIKGDYIIHNKYTEYESLEDWSWNVLYPDLGG